MEERETEREREKRWTEIKKDKCREKERGRNTDRISVL